MKDKGSIRKFQRTVWNFYRKHKRTLPWRETADPYKILISEVMLQQTQADRVVPYYQKWIKRFPSFASLATASFSEIYPLWQGLGYNRRALGLQKLAQEVTARYSGKLPEDIILLEKLPSIGPYTARAVSIFSRNRPIVCLETNIRRVFIHHFFERQEAVSDEEILPLLGEALPQKKSREWHWALMDYGAHLKGTVLNPNRRRKDYTVQSKFEGSVRQIRGMILKNLASGMMSKVQLAKSSGKASQEIVPTLATLVKEGFLEYKNKKYSLT